MLSGPEDIKLFSCSTKLSMTFIMPINVKIPILTSDKFDPQKVKASKQQLFYAFQLFV